MGFTFLDKHINEFNCEVQELKLGAPEIKRVLVEIPFSDKLLDFTKAATGKLPVGKRKIKMKINMAADSEEDLFQTFGKFLNHMYSGAGKLVLDDDPNFYYVAAVKNISELDIDICFGKFTVEFTAEGLRKSFEGEKEVKWDTFMFESEKFQNLSFNITGEEIITINNPYLEYSPKIKASGDIRAVIRGEEVQLDEGEKRYKVITLLNGDNQITFKGNGAVEIFIERVSM